MHDLEPKLLHPYVWVLTELLGLKIPEIAERAGISRGILDRAYDGRPPSDRILKKLRPLITITCNEILEQRSPEKTNNARLPIPFRFWYLHEKFVEHRQHVVALAEWVRDAYGVNEPEKLFRDTDLSAEILQQLGAAGEWRQKVLAALRAFHKKSSVKRAAKRIGVREVWKDGKCWWLPPKDITPVAMKKPPMPKIVHKSSTAPKSYKVQMALEALLNHHEEGVPALDAIARVRARTGCSVSAVYRAASELCVIREHTGFGPTKRTTWYSADTNTAQRLADRKLAEAFSKEIDKSKQFEEACAWLHEILDEPRTDGKVYAMGEARSYSTVVLDRAAKHIGVVVTKENGTRIWRRPT